MSSEDDEAGALVGHPVAARLFHAGRRLREWDTTHRWALDTAVVLVLFLLFAVPDLVPDEGPPDGPIDIARLAVPQLLLLQAALLVPLWWRRRAPLLVLHAVTVIVAVQWAAGIFLRADVAVLVAVFSLVRHGRLRRLPWAVPVLVGSFAVILVRLWAVVSIWDVTLFAVIAGTAAASLGFAGRVRSAQLVALRDRAVRLEIERDQRSRLAAATERTRVAREMHDIVGHSLSVIVTLADGGGYALDTAPERSRQALHLIGDTGRRSLAELRRMLGVLREQTDEPNLRPQPGIADLDAVCESIRAAGPQVEYRSTGELGTLDLGVQLAAYRIVQEALTNALKHAGPRTSVHLGLLVAGTRLCIVVTDTGPPGGAGPATGPGGQGHGLVGMRERATLYGGSVIAGPAPDGGWRVEADLDLESAVP